MKWLNSDISNKFVQVPTHPPLGSEAPYTTLVILDCMIAPAHIGQGSRVTYRLQSSNLQVPSFLHAFCLNSCMIKYIGRGYKYG